jgi:hypothetical protein
VSHSVEDLIEQHPELAEKMLAILADLADEFPSGFFARMDVRDAFKDPSFAEKFAALKASAGSRALAGSLACGPQANAGVAEPKA